MLWIWKSVSFYEKALGLKVMRRHEAQDGSFMLVFMGDGITDHQVELTWLRTGKSRTICRIMKYTWRLMLMILMLIMSTIRIWAVSAMKIRLWESILLKILTGTGLKLYRKGNNLAAC